MESGKLVLSFYFFHFCKIINFAFLPSFYSLCCHVSKGHYPTMYLTVPWKSWLFKPLLLAPFTLSLFPMVGVNHQVADFYSVFPHLVLDFVQRFDLSLLSLALPPLYSSPSLKFFPTALGSCSDSGDLPDWHLFPHFHIVSGLQCSSRNAGDHELVWFCLQSLGILGFWARAYGGDSN